MPAGWAARGSSPHPCLFPEIEIRDSDCISMTGCGKSRGKKPPGGGPAAGFARHMGYNCISLVGSTEAEGRTDTQGGGRAIGLHMPISVLGSSRYCVCP